MISRILAGLSCFLILNGSIRGEDCQEACLALESWRSRFASVRLEAVSIFDVAHDKSLKSASFEHKWIWEDTKRFREEKNYYENGSIRNRSLRMADRDKYYHLGFGTDPSISDPFDLTIYENSSDHVGTGVIFTPLMVLWDDHDRKWLPEFLQANSTATRTSEGYLAVPGRAIGWDEIEIHLDPAHNYLPVRSIERKYDREFEVTEFRELEPGLWFPWKGRLDIPDCKQTFEVTKVELNTPLPNELFVPQIPPGTRVRDVITGREYYHGGQPPKASNVSQPVLPQTTGENLIAAPDGVGSSSLWWLLGGAILIVSGIITRRFS